MFNFKHNNNSEFFDLFVDSAKFFYKCAVIMDEIMIEPSTAEKRVKEIIDLEHAADNVNNSIIDKLNQTFITPIDREDIFAVANGLDDGVDLLQGTVQRIVMYRTAEPKDGAIAMTKLLLQATEQIIKAFSLLKDIKKNREELLATTHRIGKLESEGDKVYRNEVASLFDNEKNPIELIKWKDIIENLEETMDHCEDLSNMIRGVVMKYA
ncbi:MAG: DUF47 domain-containing protein [Selenomonadaceae bacterium]